MMKKIAKIVSIIFHPLLIPTIGYFLLFNSGFYFSMLPWEARRMVLMIIILTTAIFPLVSLTIVAIHQRISNRDQNRGYQSLPMLFTTISYYLGYFLLNKIKALPLLQIFMLSSAMVIVLLMILTLKWQISAHMAAFGSLTAIFLALSLRTGANPFWVISAIIAASGVTGWALLLLNRHKLWHLKAGFATGFITLFLIIYLI